MCCYDEYFQVTPETGVADFTWVNCKNATSHAGFLRSLPFNGSRFYHRSSVQWGLRHAKIKWSDLGLGINGSGDLPAGYLKEALQICEEAWQLTSDAELSKKSVNSWLGLYATDKHYSYVEKVFLQTDMLPTFKGTTRMHHYENGLVSVGYQVEQTTGRSHRPFWQWVIDQEHLHLAMLRRALLELPPRAFKEIRVDSILLQAGARTQSNSAKSAEMLLERNRRSRAGRLSSALA